MQIVIVNIDSFVRLIPRAFVAMYNVSLESVNAESLHKVLKDYERSRHKKHGKGLSFEFVSKPPFKIKLTIFLKHL